MSSVERKSDTGCWIWIRQISNSGCGKITIPGPSGNFVESAHRASYAAFVGPVPKGGIVLQTCGERLCVNPEHLELKTNPV
jgi:hypothetical protein